jgi:hypothetical protein
MLKNTVLPSECVLAMKTTESKSQITLVNDQTPAFLNSTGMVLAASITS